MIERNGGLMSVIVKGMKMPKNCLHCDFDDSYGICACRNEAPYVCEYSAKQRPSWCPLEEVPSAQPETHEERTETHACDLISRQSAIDAMEDVDWYHINKNGQLVHGANSKEDEPLYKAEDVYKVLNDMPSAQPEPLSDAYTKAVWTWLLDYQIKAAELKGRYTPYEVLSWVANDWRKEHERSD